MGVVLMEGFKYIPNPGARYALINASTGTSNWNRQANRSGGYALRHTNVNTSDLVASVGRMRVTIPPTFSLGFATNNAATYTGAPGIGITGIYLKASDDNNLYGFSMPSGGPIGVFNPPSVGLFSVIDTSMTTLGWHWWNLVGIVNAASGGFLRLYRDGVKIAETAASADTSSTSGDMVSVNIYMGNSNGLQFSGIDIADLILRDDTNLIPDTRIDVLAPTSDSAAGWTRSAGTTNFSLVDDAGPTVDTSDYVSSLTPGATDTYGIADLPISPTSVYAVGAHAISRKDTGGVRTAAVMVNGTEGATMDTGSNGTVYGYWETNPSGGAAWTTATVNSMTAGIRIKA